jgi:hypothetical protein
VHSDWRTAIEGAIPLLESREWEFYETIGETD